VEKNQKMQKWGEFILNKKKKSSKTTEPEESRFT
jgi:hypothetical protein